MINPLNKYMLDALMKSSQKELESHFADISKVMKQMTDPDNDGEHMTTLNSETMYILLKEHLILRTIINSGLNVVRTFIADAELAMPRQVVERASPINLIKEFSKSIKECTPITEQTAETLMPQFEKLFKE